MVQDALFQLGMDSARLNTAQTEDKNDTQAAATAGGGKDHFIEKDGVECAGAHLIVDLYDAKRLDDLAFIERTLIDCVEAAGATLLHIHLHPFEPNGGVSGVAVLAESHISIHSWPERAYAALDVFMCGDAVPERCIEVLEKAFRPGRLEVKELLRGKEA
ncbi:adenosylmethionine decarboxylase [Chelativorans salis]|uniref:S-adenosylmethionine decarboxylase proenzyme n=1 Tax=Chelativorans salis TaxID=2978478 RepID=A0ABT2LMV3_9HYPH|nr:adenosylmethionine decarboxylase [Chelativorans sp. EGI FJ00035]MCT7375404.1 adenosylmethionine decarboxylase [Chelativorans sp. EGI FJ00035]